MSSMLEQGFKLKLASPNDTAELQKFCRTTINEIETLSFREPDRSFFFEQFDAREFERQTRDRSKTVIPTGFPTLDKILGGGLAIGRFGLWLAHTKGGKSTTLVQHGAAGCIAGANVLHMVYEGSRKESEARYDGRFAKFSYNAIDSGNTPRDVAARMREEYAKLQGRLVIRGFTTAEENSWACSAESIFQELHELKEVYDWDPQLIVVDYADLLTGRDKFYRTENDRQRAAYRDLKTLVNSGYAMWTASQTQRPPEGYELKPEIIRSRQSADNYDKIRVADFVGSINATDLEKEHKVARLYAELARGAAADHIWTVRADFEKMIMFEEQGVRSPHSEVAATAPPRLGYGKGGIDSKPMRRRGEQTRAF
jgi:hypothetical protein